MSRSTTAHPARVLSAGTAALFLAATIAACASGRPHAPYVDVYADAMTDAKAGDTQPGGPRATVDAFVELMTGLRDNPDWERDVRALYAPELYFSDTLTIARSHDQLVAHFRRLREADAHIDVILEDVVTGGDATYVRWRMHNEFRVPGRDVSARTIGITLFRFDREGRIAFHQDYWDSTEGFYRHLPVLGSIIGQIGKRFASVTP